MYTARYVLSMASKNAVETHISMRVVRGVCCFDSRINSGNHIRDHRAGSSRLFLFIYFYPIYYPRTTLALPPSNNSDPGSHSGPSSPSPLRYVSSFLSREEFSIFFPRRLASNCAFVPHAARRSQQLIRFFFFFFFTTGGIERKDQR